MRLFARVGARGLLVVLSAVGLGAQVGQKAVIELSLAKQLVAVAEREIAANKWTMFVVIVDDSGLPIFTERVGDAQPGSFDIAVKKARTAALFRRPTKVFEDLFKTGTTIHATTDSIIAIEGGVPLALDGKVIGAIGVSGGSPVQDGQVAMAVASALAGLVGKKQRSIPWS